MYIKNLGMKEIRGHESMFSWFVRRTPDTFIYVKAILEGYNVTCYNRGGHHVSGSEYDSKRLKEYKGIRLPERGLDIWLRHLRMLRLIRS